MKPRMKIKRALAICRRGPKTEAQRTQAMAALRQFGAEVARDYPGVSGGTCAQVDTARDRLAVQDLRGSK